MYADLMIIDYDLSGFKRYAVEISTHLKSIKSEFKIVWGYVSNDFNLSTDSFENIDAIFTIRKSSVKDIFDKYSPKSVMVFAYRFVDYMFTLEAHRRGIIVFNFQHGLYAENTGIDKLTSKNYVALQKNKKEKVKEYMRCIWQITGKNIISTASIMFKLFSGKSMHSVLHGIFGDSCTAEVSFVYGNFWEKYCSSFYSVNTTKFVVIGYPELEGRQTLVQKDTFSNKTFPIICYLAQTAVEDLMVEESVMITFFKRLIPILKNYNLVIKLHPRSDKKLYRVFTDSEYADHVYFWSEQAFPIADIYIGHDSTVIARALNITDRTLIYRLREGRQSLFDKYAKYHADETSDLNNVMQCMLNDENIGQCAENVKEIAKLNCLGGALRQTAHEIVETLESKN